MVVLHLCEVWGYTERDEESLQLVKNLCHTIYKYMILFMTLNVIDILIFIELRQSTVDWGKS